MHSSRTFLLACLALLLPAAGFAQSGDPAADPRPEKRAGARGSAEPGLELEEPHALFGEVYQYAEISHLFAFRNKSARPVLIEEAIALAGGGRVEAVPRRVPPGGTGEIRVVQPIADQLGRAAFRYALVTDEPGVARYRFSLSGFVESAYDPEKPEFAFGEVDRDRGARLEIEISSREVARLELAEKLELPSWLALEVAGRAGEDQQGLRLQASLKGRPPLGWLHETVRLRTNVPSQPIYPLRVAATVYGDVVPSAGTVSFGAVDLGGTYRESVELRSRSGKPLALRSAADPAKWLKATLAPCPPRPDDPACRRVELELAVAPLAAQGPFSGKIEIVGDDGEVLPLIYHGIVIAPGTPIRQIEVPAEAGGTPPKPAGGGR